MANLPSIPDNLSVEEWRRAVALLASVTLHGESNPGSLTAKFGVAVDNARRFEQYLRDGTTR